MTKNHSFKLSQPVGLNGKHVRSESPREIEIRVIFLRIGDIDTLNEKFFAEVLIESKWQEPRLVSEFTDCGYNSTMTSSVGLGGTLAAKSSIEEHELTSNANKFWNPQIYIENALNDPQQTLYYKVGIGILTIINLTG